MLTWRKNADFQGQKDWLWIKPASIGFAKRNKAIQISGPLLKQKALEAGSSLDLENFNQIDDKTSSNTWM